MRAAAAVCVLVLAACHGEQPSTPSQSTSALVAYVGMPAHQEEVRRAAQTAAAWQAMPCPGASFGPGEVVSVLTPATFDVQGRVTGGTWQERVVAQGCGGERSLNVSVAVPSPGRTVYAPLLPGSTRADAVLQNDGVLAIRAVLPARAGCGPDRAFVAESRYVGPEAAGAAEGRMAWREEWTVVACDRRAVFTVHFTPDTKGGTYLRVNPAEMVQG